MNQNANQNTSNTTGAAPASGLMTALKVAVPLVALVAIVFGLTLFATYAPKSVEKDADPVTMNTRVPTEPPVRFFTSGRVWDPPDLTGEYRELPMLAPSAVAQADGRTWSFELANRLFQGVYEQDPTATPRYAQFWFENRNPNTVTLQLKHVSCGSCTRGRVAAIPPQVTKNLLHHSALAALPIGPFNGYGVGLTQPLAQLATKLEWTEYVFKDAPDATYNVPAAPANADKWTEQWGILELGFEVKGNPSDPPKPLEADFAATVDGTPRTTMNKIVLGYETAFPCDLGRQNIDVGRLDHLSTDKEYEFLVFSSTRGPGSEFGDLTLKKENCLAQGPGGAADPLKFVEVLKVERLPEAELVDVTERIARERKRYFRVRSAYRVTVVVRPKVGETRMEIGEIDRTVSVTFGGAVRQVRITGVVRGAVRLDEDRRDINLREFRGSTGTKQDVDLITENPGIEIALVKTECTPDYYGYELVKQPDRGGQGHYKLFITVPPGKQSGREKGDVVLEVKGPNPQRIRIPLRSNALFAQP